MTLYDKKEISSSSIKIRPITQLHKTKNKILTNLKIFDYIQKTTSSLKLKHITRTWWRIDRVEAFQPEDCGFESRSSRHKGTLRKSLTHSCLWRFSVKLRHSICAVSGTLLSRSGLEEALSKWSE